MEVDIAWIPSHSEFGIIIHGMAATENYKTLAYPSFYLKDFEAAVAFYQGVFGPPATDDASIKGWKFGDTWLTLFPSKHGPHPDSNPRGAEFAIQVSSKAEVDGLYERLLQAGAQECMPPKDTHMYEPMRFCCVDDPFGVRIDIYYPLDPAAET